MNLTVHLVLKNIHKQCVDYEVPPCCSTTIESNNGQKAFAKGCHCELKTYRRSFKYGTVFPGLQNATDHNTPSF